MTKKRNLKVVYRSVLELVPYARNARTHSEEQIEQIVSSIKEFGFTSPVLIDEEGGIIAGHGRVLAAKQLEMKEVPTIELAGLTPEQRRAYVIADNKLALDAGWDADLLASELQELGDLGFDLDLTGFSFDEIDELLNENGNNHGSDDDPEDDEEYVEDKPSNFNYEEKYAVLVECEDEEDQAEIYAKLKDMGLTCKVLVN